jgi:Flp pilus assembly pilin Flp
MTDLSRDVREQGRRGIDMGRLVAGAKKFWMDESGANPIEYTIFAGLVSAGCACAAFLAHEYASSHWHNFVYRLTSIFPDAN